MLSPVREQVLKAAKKKPGYELVSEDEDDEGDAARVKGEPEVTGPRKRVATDRFAAQPLPEPAAKKRKQQSTEPSGGGGDDDLASLLKKRDADDKQRFQEAAHLMGGMVSERDYVAQLRKVEAEAAAEAAKAEDHDNEDDDNGGERDSDGENGAAALAAAVGGASSAGTGGGSPPSLHHGDVIAHADVMRHLLPGLVGEEYVGTLVRLSPTSSTLLRHDEVQSKAEALEGRRKRGGTSHGARAKAASKSSNGAVTVVAGGSAGFPGNLALAPLPSLESLGLAAASAVRSNCKPSGTAASVISSTSITTPAASLALMAKVHAWARHREEAAVRAAQLLQQKLRLEQAAAPAASAATAGVPSSSQASTYLPSQSQLVPSQSGLGASQRLSVGGDGGRLTYTMSSGSATATGSSLVRSKAHMVGRSSGGIGRASLPGSLPASAELLNTSALSTGSAAISADAAVASRVIAEREFLQHNLPADASVDALTSLLTACAHKGSSSMLRYPSLVDTSQPLLPGSVAAPLAVCGPPIDVSPCLLPPPPHPLLTSYKDSPLYSHQLVEAARRHASPQLQQRSRSRSAAWGETGAAAAAAGSALTRRSSSSSSGGAAAQRSSSSSSSSSSSGAVSPAAATEASLLYARLRRHDPGTVWGPLAPVLVQQQQIGGIPEAAEGSNSGGSLIDASSRLPVPIAALSTHPVMGCGAGYGTHTLLSALGSSSTPLAAATITAGTTSGSDVPPNLPVPSWLRCVAAFLKQQNETSSSSSSSSSSVVGAADGGCEHSSSLTALTCCTDALAHSIGCHAVSLSPMPRSAVRRLTALLSGGKEADSRSSDGVAIPTAGKANSSSRANSSGAGKAKRRKAAASPSDDSSMRFSDTEDEDEEEDDVVTSDEPDEFDADEDDDDGEGDGGGVERGGHPDMPVWLYHKSGLVQAASTALLLLAHPTIAAHAEKEARYSPTVTLPAPRPKKKRRMKGFKAAPSAAENDDNCADECGATETAAAAARTSLLRLLATIADVMVWREGVLTEAWDKVRKGHHTSSNNGVSSSSQASAKSEGADDGEEEDDGGASKPPPADPYHATRAEAHAFGPHTKAMDHSFVVEIVANVVRVALRQAYEGPHKEADGASGGAGASTSPNCSGGAGAGAGVSSSISCHYASIPPSVLASPTELGAWLQRSGQEAVGVRVAVWNDRAEPQHWRQGVLSAYYAYDKKLTAGITARAGMHQFTADGGGRAYLRLSTLLVRPLTSDEMAAALAPRSLDKDLTSALPFPHAGCLATILQTVTSALTGSEGGPLGPRLYTASARPQVKSQPSCSAPASPFPATYHYLTAFASRSPLGAVARRLAIISAHAITLLNPSSVPAQSASDVIAGREIRRMQSALARLKAKQQAQAAAQGKAATYSSLLASGAAGTGAKAAATAKASAAAEVAAGKQSDIRNVFHKLSSSSASAKPAASASAGGGKKSSASSSSSLSSSSAAAASTPTRAGRANNNMASSSVGAVVTDGDGQLVDTLLSPELVDGNNEVDYGASDVSPAGAADNDNGALMQAADAGGNAGGSDDSDEDEDEEDEVEIVTDSGCKWLPRLPVKLLKELGQEFPPDVITSAQQQQQGKRGQRRKRGVEGDTSGVAHLAPRILHEPGGLTPTAFALARIMNRVDAFPPKPPAGEHALSHSALAAHWETHALVLTLLRQALLLTCGHVPPPSPLLPSAAAAPQAEPGPVMKHTQYAAAAWAAVAAPPAAAAESAPSSLSSLSPSLLQNYPIGGEEPSPSSSAATPSAPSLLVVFVPYLIPPALRPKPVWFKKALEYAKQWEAAAGGRSASLPARRFQTVAQALVHQLAAFAPKQHD